MAERMRVVVAMSGGVDSAVAAARLVDEGHDVVGVTLHLWDYPDDPNAKGSHGRCCAPEDQYDAKRMADAIGFPHYTFDRRQLFLDTVVNPFVDSYVAGETPSPCTTCNRGVKLKELFAIADKLGAPKVATGHYARTAKTADGITRLLTGVDTSKDQSYFLYATPREQLERLVFPLGESTKFEVRAEAVSRDLPGATKGESQELCFVGAGQHAYASFVEERAGKRVRPGMIVDELGRPVGEHQGIHRFTVGQRKGIGVAIGKPAFVTDIDPISGTVRVGDEAGLTAESARLTDLHLAEGISLPLEARVRVRYRHDGVNARIVANANGASIRFHGGVRAATRGQIAVFYDGDAVLGGGRISEVSSAKDEVGSELSGALLT